ncbi:aldo/keto reductase [Paludibacterium yongneupense]|uniref:aldo/keto reductase n=1 Tax=Paludibacterium yongneupense TaxID=400061 RepID=UPI00040A9B82|nr:aldo/keto reductase [Paludibacterium yongneupense]
MRTVTLPGGERVPALGMGSWSMGEIPAHRRDEIATVRLGVELGTTLIDTAEMYGEGLTEQFLGEALSGLRERVFLVSKVYPHNASRRGVQHACEQSLRRLRTDRLDLYLLHWRGREPLAETIAGFEDLRAAGKIRYWGVSNFDTDDMEELFALPGGDRCAVNQVLYNLTRRGPEFDLLPWMRAHDVPLMAYSPIEQGRVANGGAIAAIAAQRGVSHWQVALAWVLRRPDAIAIPQTSKIAHLRLNYEAGSLVLSDEELAQLDSQFAPPARKRALEMI